jgi:ribosome-binding protein aMBF1 (putative translation factor)
VVGCGEEHEVFEMGEAVAAAGLVAAAGADDHPHRRSRALGVGDDEDIVGDLDLGRARRARRNDHGQRQQQLAQGIQHDDSLCDDFNVSG